ncbi:hypothetical protein BV25DRAFT_1516494 [Artomyces pyxidatus]|uniref:Uncharacterized protein n=1 Tax=Artomyces pyxidatus TaxID=48021 RepID=A0ACB8TBD6_9AGAM|nr:hypothetical protein BV25DRAFT_1516494 [Artomyces pyxidatus]
MFTRSKAAPVTVRLTPGLYQRLTPTIVTHLFHIESIALVKDWPEIDLEVFMQSLTEAAPLLESLHVFNVSYDRNITVPINMFGNCTPRLRNLHLCRCIFSWAWFSFQGLERLHVSCKPKNRGPLMGHDKFWDFLDNIRHTLRSITLIDCLPSRPISDSRNRVIKFQTLAQISLTGTALECIQFLHSVDIPISTSLSLSLSSEAGADVCYEALPFVSEHLSRARVFIQEVTLDAAWDGPGRFCFSVLASDDLSPKGAACIAFSLSWRGPHETIILPVARRILDALPIRNIQRLCVDSEEFPWTPALWRGIYGDFKDIRSLHISGPAFDGLCDTSLIPTDGPDENIEPGTHQPTNGSLQTGHLLFPRLARLLLYHVDLLMTEDATIRNTPFFSWLSRHGQHALTTLEIEECYTAPQDVEAMAQVVAQVSWDGITNGLECL